MRRWERHAGREELDLAGDEHPKRLRVAAGDVVVLRVDARVDAPAGFPADVVPHRHKLRVQRTFSDLVVILAEGEFRRRRGLRKHEHAANAGHEIASGNLHAAMVLPNGEPEPRTNHRLPTTTHEL